MGVDYFLFSGEIDKKHDLAFIRQVDEQCERSSNKTAVVVMCSNGGSPDAAYKMARHLQHRYDYYSVIVSGFCKSAATLFTIGAKEIIFTPYGELGPLDIQLRKEDKLFSQESGLNITEAMIALDERARESFARIFIDMLASPDGVISIKTASEVAISMVSALYAPVFRQIEPEEVGSRVRAMRIGEDYARRLNKYENIDEKSLDKISRKYASHSFVIDYVEAKTLFKEVRLVSDMEAKLIGELGSCCYYPSTETIIKAIQTEDVSVLRKEEEENLHEENKRPKSRKPATKGAGANGKNRAPNGR